MSTPWTWKHSIGKTLGSQYSLRSDMVTARELLVEWGNARALIPLGEVVIDRWNYDSEIGFGMYFTGKKSAVGESRLTGHGCYGHEVMRGREEHWPEKDATAQPVFRDEMIAALEHDDPEAWAAYVQEARADALKQSQSLAGITGALGSYASPLDW